MKIHNTNNKFKEWKMKCFVLCIFYGVITDGYSIFWEVQVMYIHNRCIHVLPIYCLAMDEQRFAQNQLNFMTIESEFLLNFIQNTSSRNWHLSKNSSLGLCSHLWCQTISCSQIPLIYTRCAWSSQSKLRVVLTISKSSGRALFQYSCTPHAVLTRAWGLHRLNSRMQRVDSFAKQVVLF